ncbi:MAG TPA: hypothetical protein VF030_08880 [Solirubrobacterales bacterium]
MKRSSSTRLLLVAAIFVLALVAAGCGDDGDSGGDAEAEVTTLVEESVAFEDPATICEENFSDALLEENYDGKDREAWIEDCADDEEGEIAELEVSEVKVNGETATAAVSARNEGEDETAEFTVELRDEDGWKINAVK